MKKHLLTTVAVAGTLAFAGAAHAEFNILATIDKDKQVFVFEDIFVDKDVFINAVVDSTPEKAAEALALINQENFENTACTNCAEKTDIIENAFSGNSGIVTWNQTSGNLNNQGNAVATSVDFSTGDPPPDIVIDDGTGFAEAQAHGDQRTADNEIETVNLVFRDAFLTNSGNGNSGILLINQGPGTVNNQANGVALAVSFATEGVALAESDLGQETTGNTILESDANFDDPEVAIFVGINRTAEINGSLNGNQGIIGVNQATGSAGNQGNFFSVASVNPGT